MDSRKITFRGQSLETIGQTLKRQAVILGGFVALIWLLELIDIFLLGGALDAWGVRPRTLTGLRGILLMPFLHDGLGHVLANTFPFLVLGWLVMVRERREFFIVSGVVILVSGLGVWLFAGGQSIHIGASGLVFGYFGYLLLRAYFERSLPAILLAVLVVFLYGGFIWGILPLRLGISWQGHLFGFVGGVAAAYLVTRLNHQETEAARPY